MADIISVDTGGRYSLEFAKSVINATWAQANTKSSEFEAKLDNLLNTTGGVLSDSEKPVVTAATTAETSVVEPAISLPASIDSQMVLAEFDAKHAEMVSVLSDHYSAFITNYFPLDSALFSDAADWISAAINTPDQAIPQSIRDQMIDDERTRINNEATQAVAQVMDDFAARGFPVPPGAALAATVDIQTAAMGEVGKAARAVAIKNFELSYDKIKTAIALALDARKEAMGAAVQYIGQLATAPDSAVKAAGLGYGEQSRLIGAVSQFYSARTNAAELALKSKQFNASQTQMASSENAKVDLQFTSDRVKALVQQATSLAQMTTSLFNNLHASSGVSFGDSLSETI